MADMHKDNVTDYHSQNPWGARAVWHHRGAVAMGACRAYVQTSPQASDDALWRKAEALADHVFDVHLDTGNPVSDSGFLSAISATIVPALFAYMQEVRDRQKETRNAD